MATNNKLSALIEQQFPDYFRTEGPNIVAFLKAYYAWMEEDGGVIDAQQNYLNYLDIDTTLPSYMEYFQRELFDSLPRNMLANKALVAKNIKELYKAKGSEDSYKLLFRILYDENIDFYYPGEDILRLSDGRWQKRSSINVYDLPNGQDFNAFQGSTITGQNSGATADVNAIVLKQLLGIDVYELTLLSVVGTFQDSEPVHTSANTVQGTIFAVAGALVNVDIAAIGTGSQHQVNDRINITSASGSGANAYVTETTDSAMTFAITSGGTGYRIGNSHQVTLAGGDGVGGHFSIDTISSTEGIMLNDDLISCLANTTLDTGATFATGGSNTCTLSANMAIANISSPLNAGLAFTNTTIGTINTISTTDFGVGYNILPTVTTKDLQVFSESDGAKGGNAVIAAQSIYGAITSLSILNAGSAYGVYDMLTLSNLTRTATNGTGAAVVSGVTTENGSYIDTKGWLSWDKKMQDNFYYQEYSYVLKVQKFITEFSKVVSEVIHPAGTQMFSEYDIHDPISVSPSFANTLIEVWTGGVGTMHISNILAQNAYSANSIANVHAAAIADLGTSKMLWGGANNLPSNTLFLNTTSNDGVTVSGKTSSIRIVDDAFPGVIEEQLYTANVVSSHVNMTLTKHVKFANGDNVPVATGLTYYYLANSDAG
jgi:hypothetical protein